MSRPFTGKHMAFTMVAFFGTVMAVNFTMASFANSTFSGVQVQNSYVASQNFNIWLQQARQQKLLGWEVESTLLPDRRLRVLASGPGTGAQLGASARHPLGRMNDIDLAFVRQADGSFLSQEPLPQGRWIVRLRLVEGGDEWRREDRF